MLGMQLELHQRQRLHLRQLLLRLIFIVSDVVQISKFYGYTLGYDFASVWRVQVKRGLIARRNKLVVDQQLGFDYAVHSTMRIIRSSFLFDGSWVTYHTNKTSSRDPKVRCVRASEEPGGVALSAATALVGYTRFGVRWQRYITATCSRQSTWIVCCTDVTDTSIPHADV